MFEFLIFKSVVSKYSLLKVLTRKFLNFDIRLDSYLSDFHKMSIKWGEFWMVQKTELSSTRWLNFEEKPRFPISTYITNSHWTYWLQIHSKLCFQRVALSGNYEIVAIITDKNTFFNDLDYKADIGQHFHKSEKSARGRHHHKIIKTNLKTHVPPLLTRP